MRFRKIYIILAILALIAIIIATGMFLRTSPEPKPIPRNMSVLIESPLGVYRFSETTNWLQNTHFLFIVDGDRLEVIQFRDSPYNRDIDEELSHFDEALRRFIPHREPLDMTLLNDFAEHSYGHGFSSRLCNTHETYVVFDRRNVVFTQEELEEVWLLIDGVVLNYKEPRIKGTHNAITTIRASIDGEIYRSRLNSSELFRRYNYRVPNSRRYREDADGIDANLLRLTHHLIDISPITIDRE